MFSNRVILYHILCWVAYLLVIALGADKVDLDFALKNISSTLPVAAVFYINTLLVFPDYFQNRKYVVGFLLLILVCLLTIGIRAFLIIFFPAILPPFDPIQFLNQLKMDLLFTGISFVYWLAIKNYQNEKHRQQLERDVAEAKLTILKNQINPHFLYNSLSLLYSKTLPLSGEVSELVGKISEMMRYSLEEAEDNGLVPLEKEIAHLKNYVDIHQLRFDNKLNINFEVSGDVKNHHIAPLLLITFVENAFKHGKFNEDQHPLIIKLEAKNGEVNFLVENLKTSGLKEKSSGIGLSNIKSRLQLLYPVNHKLVITDRLQNYSVNLKIWNAV